jgi:hypothetical protein
MKRAFEAAHPGPNKLKKFKKTEAATARDVEELEARLVEVEEERDAAKKIDPVAAVKRLIEEVSLAASVRDALGHANVSTSNAYVAASPERLRLEQPRFLGFAA